MRLTFIVTIDPIKELALLGASIHSLNLQTRRTFDVLFYNQTSMDEEEIFDRIGLRPEFDHAFTSIPREDFLGAYPLWDLYAVHAAALQADSVGDYFASVHMEEFFEADYVERVGEVLAATGFDILFGNLCRTWFDETFVGEIVATRTPDEFTALLRREKLHRASHWAFHNDSDSRIAWVKSMIRRRSAFRDFGIATRLTPTASGCRKLGVYHEDIFFMSKEFARRYDWFLTGKRMYFEDVHICQNSGVCELAPELAKLTPFPVYLNSSRAYHLNHRRFYYQLEDPTFTDRMLALQTDDPQLRAHQKAIEMYRAGRMTRDEALRYTRANAEKTGTQNFNYRYHMEAIRNARSPFPPESNSS